MSYSLGKSSDRARRTSNCNELEVTAKAREMEYKTIKSTGRIKALICESRKCCNG